jgi:hypothetical protein
VLGHVFLICKRKQIRVDNTGMWLRLSSRQTECRTGKGPDPSVTLDGSSQYQVLPFLQIVQHPAALLRTTACCGGAPLLCVFLGQGCRKSFFLPSEALPGGRLPPRAASRGDLGAFQRNCCWTLHPI